MATKLDLSRPLFMGATPAKEHTFNDHMRRAVMNLNEGAGVPYAKLEEYMLRNYTPGKSNNYGSSFIKSYARDGVNKYGFLSYTDEGHEYAVETAPARRERAPSEPRKPGKARMEELEVLKFIRDAGEVADAGDVDNTQISPADIAGELGKRRKTIDAKVEKLEAEGLLRSESEPTADGTEGDVNTLVYLTAAGLSAVNAAFPEGAGSAPEQDGGPATEVDGQPIEGGDEA